MEEVELIKRRMLRELVSRRGSTAGSARCPYERWARAPTFNDALSKCKVALADFWAEWCGPCRLTEPIFEELAAKYAGRVAFLKVNVDENPDLAVQYDVMSIPTMIVFKGGKEFKRFIGYSPLLARQLDLTLQGLIAG
ncbi:thioredoxin [Thermofilum pendens]|uniref:Thioredoxin n=1 Tax=Thermofilum pendens (strain DSM 2475 / Hrk 5) TaxID=368408 RepID=A1RZ97_THEPD|nr:thioredoxin [Thermofilum pendens]ABL78527.1 thioredoxin [Thermofilum pendens Hrk 5]